MKILCVSVKVGGDHENICIAITPLGVVSSLFVNILNDPYIAQRLLLCSKCVYYAIRGNLAHMSNELSIR